MDFKNMRKEHFHGPSHVVNLGIVPSKWKLHCGMKIPGSFDSFTTTEQEKLTNTALP